METRPLQVSQEIPNEREITPTSNNNAALSSKLTAEEELRQKELIESTKLMFKNVSEYLKSELQATSLDFQLLENMNEVTKQKYTELNTVANNLSVFLEDLQKKYRDFEPYLKKIEQIDNNVGELENTVQLLDEYTKRLEEKFKKLVAQRKEAKKGVKV